LTRGAFPAQLGRDVDELAGKALDQFAELRMLLRLPAVRELVVPVATAADERVERLALS
jgi:hypothetical protein